MSGTDFLTVNPAQRVKKEIENIYQSYSHPWDILAELAQNSVDAIKEWEERFPEEDKDHYINIKINKNNNSIEIKDSGVGIKPDRVPQLLAPNGTDKAGKRSTIGEKGVGLTFCIFCCNKFNLETTSKNGYYEGEINFARDWREEETIEGDSIPKIENENKEKEKFDPSETETKVLLKDVKVEEDGKDIFSLTPKRLSMPLRRRSSTTTGRKKIQEIQRTC